VKPVVAAAIGVLAVASVGVGVAATHSAGANVALAASSMRVSYATQTSWDTGYTGQYTITNTSSGPLTGWTLGFTLPSGSSVSSLWNGDDTVSGTTVTVKPASWNGTIGAGQSATIGFVIDGTGQPSDCTIDGAACTAGAAASPSASPSVAVSATASAPASPTATASSPPSSGTTATSFAPYVDTTLFPAYNLTTAMDASGVKTFNLAFVTDAGSCTPEWGGVDALTTNGVATQISALRAAGGNVRISFGGEAGTELADDCSSLSALTAAYNTVINDFSATMIDFDIEGAALDNTAGNTLRSEAIAQLEKDHPGLQVSFTLPVLPSGLTSDGVNLLTNAVQNGDSISAVNIMAMDYGDGAAPNPSGQMGTYAIDAATATEAQLNSVFGVSSSWSKLAITPMIGVNDTSDEIFTVANATQVAQFAASKGMAWTSMWSAARDVECSGGAQTFASATCSSIVQSPYAFMDAFAAG
jgi:Cellulose binding domain